MFDHRPCNCKSVKGTCTTSDLIQDQKTLCSSISKNIGNLCHFYHKRTLSACKVIRSPDTGKNTVHNTNVCFFCRDKASDLCHQNDQCCLTHVSRFTCHIRTGNDRNSFFLIIKISIICDKHIILYHLLNNRMSAVLDIQHAIFIDLRSDKIISFRHKCKRSKNVQGCDCLCCLLNTDNLFANLLTYICKKFIFQSVQTVFCTKDQILQFFQFLCDITLRIRKRLFADIIIRHLIFKRICHLKRITKYTAVFDLKRLDTGTFFFSCFQLCKPFFSVCSGTTVFVDICVIAFTYDTAILLRKRRLICDRTFDQTGHILQRIHIFQNLFQDRCFKFLKDLPDIRDHFQRRCKRDHIPRIR